MMVKTNDDNNDEHECKDDHDDHHDDDNDFPLHPDRVALKHPEWAASRIITTLLTPEGAAQAAQAEAQKYADVGRDFQKQ
jgi:hypothetical protein